MEVTDYNGEGSWSREGILARYAKYAAEMGIVPRDLSPKEHSEGGRHWVYPVMETVIAGIDAGDPACILLGIEFIEQDSKFPFGKILKSSTARALRRAPLSQDQQQRIRKRVLGMLRAGHVPHEFSEYARLLKKIGIDAADLDEVRGTSARVSRFRAILQAAARPDNR